MFRGKDQSENPDQVANFNKTGLPIVNEQVSLRMVSPKAALAPEYTEMEIFKRLEAETNVKIEWENIPDTDFAEKKNLPLASGNLPDAFTEPDFPITSWLITVKMVPSSHWKI